jgi:hypothetical protein
MVYKRREKERGKKGGGVAAKNQTSNKKKFYKGFRSLVFGRHPATFFYQVLFIDN